MVVLVAPEVMRPWEKFTLDQTKQTSLV